MENRLKVYRAIHDLTQAELAKKLDVTRATINAIENQRYDPSLKLAFQIARFFHVPIEQIFLYEGETTGVEEISHETSILHELAGSLGRDAAAEDYRDYLEKKYLDNDRAND